MADSTNDTHAGYTLVCRDCGNLFVSHGANAFYCHKCAALRKKRLDHEAWIRRKAKANGGKRRPAEIKKEAVAKLERAHAKELHIDMLYYGLWKACNPIAYKTWMESKLPPELLCVGKPLVSKTMLREATTD